MIVQRVDEPLKLLFEWPRYSEISQVPPLQDDGRP
jgi:hypothetical protein